MRRACKAAELYHKLVDFCAQIKQTIDKAARFFNFGCAFQPGQRSITTKPFIAYLTASRAELAKVTWPTRRQTVRLTFLVIIFSLVLAAILGALDLVFQGIVQKLIGA